MDPSDDLAWWKLCQGSLLLPVYIIGPPEVEVVGPTREPDSFMAETGDFYMAVDSGRRNYVASLR
jgi:hypothetical protein